MHFSKKYPERIELEALRDQEAERTEKLNRLVGFTLDKFADVASRQYGGLPLISAEMSEFYLDKLPPPNRHEPGVVRGARFIDGILLRITTANTFSDALHILTYPAKPSLRSMNEPTYQKKPINVDTQATGEHIPLLSTIEEIAEVPSIEYNLGKMYSSLEVENKNNWPHAIGAHDLKNITRQ